MMKQDSSNLQANEIFSQSEDEMCIVTDESSDDMPNRFDEES